MEKAVWIHENKLFKTTPTLHFFLHSETGYYLICCICFCYLLYHPNHCL